MPEILDSVSSSLHTRDNQIIPTYSLYVGHYMSVTLSRFPPYNYAGPLWHSRDTDILLVCRSRYAGHHVQDMSVNYDSVRSWTHLTPCHDPTRGSPPDISPRSCRGPTASDEGPRQLSSIKTHLATDTVMPAQPVCRKIIPNSTLHLTYASPNLLCEGTPRFLQVPGSIHVAEICRAPPRFLRMNRRVAPRVTRVPCGSPDRSNPQALNCPTNACYASPRIPRD